MDIGNVTNGSLHDNETYIPDFPPVWGFWVKFISTPILVTIGMVGNTLSLIVMKSPALRHKSYSHFLCALAVFDTITLVIRQVRIIDEYLVDHKAVRGVFQDFGDAGCKVYYFLEHVAYLMSSWLVVLMAIERLIAVCFPFKRVIIRRQSGSIIVIAMLLILVCASQVFRLVMIEHILLDDYLDIWVCSASDMYIKMYTTLDVYFYQLALTFLVPVALVLGCNTLVLYQIVRVRREVQQNQKGSKYNHIVKKRHTTTCMLLIVSFTYIITLLPLFTLAMVVDVSVKLKDGPSAWDVYRTLSPYLEVCTAFSLVNYAVNFFIYVLSGKRFRFELRKVFHKEAKPTRSFVARPSTREEFYRTPFVEQGSASRARTSQPFVEQGSASRARTSQPLVY